MRWSIDGIHASVCSPDSETWLFEKAGCPAAICGSQTNKPYRLSGHILIKSVFSVKELASGRDFLVSKQVLSPRNESSMPPSPPETRASLILRLPNAADSAAWEEVVQVYGPVVFRMARKQGLQGADADDLVQEVFTAVAKQVEQWLWRSDRGPLRAWVLRIARNIAVNAPEKRSREKEPPTLTRACRERRRAELPRRGQVRWCVKVLATFVSYRTIA